MYEGFFGLSARPFADRPDPDFFFDSEQHAAALRALSDAIQTSQPLAVITGETGCGKTVLARALLRGIGADVTVGIITNPHVSVGDLTRWALFAFDRETGLETESELQEALALYFVSEYSAGRKCLLVVDEAQNLTASAVAGLQRHLDINAPGECLLQIILVAQPRLLETLRDPTLAPWSGRVPLICPVGPLPVGEVADYVRSRLAAAGADREIFTRRAIAAIGRASGGVPRLINAIGDMALVYAFGRGRDTVDRDVIDDVLSDGRAAGFGPLSMLAPLEGAEEIEPAATPVEAAAPVQGPVHAIEAAAENDIAPFLANDIVTGTEPPAAIAAAAELQDIATPTPARLEDAASDPAGEAFAEELVLEDVVPADFVPPSPAAPDLQQIAIADAPAPAQAVAPPIAHALPGWPSISRHSGLTRLARAGSINARATSGGLALRRRFLPRD
jgi:general secretion pathway protein A